MITLSQQTHTARYQEERAVQCLEEYSAEEAGDPLSLMRNDTLAMAGVHAQLAIAGRLADLQQTISMLARLALNLPQQQDGGTRRGTRRHRKGGRNGDE